MEFHLDDNDIQRIAESVSQRILAGRSQQSEIVSVSQAAKYLGGISPKTLYSWINAGKIKAYNPGGKGSRVMLRISDLDRFIDQSVISAA